MKAAMPLLGGGEGCTQLRELLQPVATVAFQTMTIYRQPAAPKGGKQVNLDRVNRCYAYKEDSEMVREYRAQMAETQPY